MIVLTPQTLEFSDSYVEGFPDARWRSASGQLPTGGVAVVPEDVPHEVRNPGPAMLRFVAVYASPEVVTRYEHDVQPDGIRERQTVA